jgi:hypothetical protein
VQRTEDRLGITRGFSGSKIQSALHGGDGRILIIAFRPFETTPAFGGARACRHSSVCFDADQRMMISTRRFCDSRTFRPVGTKRCVSPKPWMLMAFRGTPSLTSSAATACARRTDSPWL